MDAFILYSIKVSICLVLLYIGVKAFLSKETFFRFNRLTLLLGITICIIIPAIHINIEDVSVLHQPMQILEEAVSVKENSIPIEESNIKYHQYPLSETGLEYPTAEESKLSVSHIILIIYLTGVFINLVILLHSFRRMNKLIQGGVHKLFIGYTLVLTDQKICPFSWKKYIVLSEEDYKNNPDEIISHELAHIKYRHSLDIIFMELILLFQWFNPAIWLLKRELKNIHEYQADMSVLKSGIDATKYQLLLVKKAVGASSYTLANSFNHSKIKKRITMMLKEKSNKWAKLKLMLLFPAITTCMYAFAQPAVNNLAETGTAIESTNILSEDEISEEQVFHDSKKILDEMRINQLEKDTVPQKRIDARTQNINPEIRKEMDVKIQKMNAEIQKEIEVQMKKRNEELKSLEAEFRKEIEAKLKDSNDNPEIEMEMETMRQKIDTKIQEINADMENIIGTKVQKMETELQKEMEAIMKEKEKEFK